jgi:hypothetical protein
MLPLLLLDFIALAKILFSVHLKHSTFFTPAGVEPITSSNYL